MQHADIGKYETRSIMEPFIESFVTTLLKATSYRGVAHALYYNDALVEGIMPL